MLKQNELKRPVAIILVMICMSSCDYYDDRMHFINDRTETICLDYSVDTFLAVPSGNKKEYFLSRKIEPTDTFNNILPGSTSGWLWYVSQGKDSTLRIFVFDYKKVLNNNWDTLRKNNDYIKRIDYSLKELQENKWMIHIN